MPQPRALSKIRVRNGKQAGACFSLSEGDKKVIGRDNNCDIQVLDKGISRNHSLLEHKGDHFLLVDLGSTNGTFVNEKIIISKILENGDILKIGQTEILFEEAKDPAPAPISLDEDDAGPNNTIIERKYDDVVEQSLCAISQNQAPQQFGRQSSTSAADTYLKTIYEVSNIINAEQDQQKLFNLVMDKIFDVFKPDRAFLVMIGEKDYHVVVARDVHEGANAEHKLSRTILRKTIEKGNSVLSGNPVLDGYGENMSIVTQHIKSVMSVPLESQNKILGAIYMDSVSVGNRFNQTHLELLTAIGKQAGVAIERAKLFEQVMEQAKLKQEMAIAQNIQKNLLPSTKPAGFEYDLVGWNRSCDDTGGDYYDFFELSNNRLGFAIGDVTGHGIGAAFHMAMGRALLRALAFQNKGLVEMISELNNLLERDMEDDQFMTLFYGELDLNKMVLHYVNAGHDDPLLYRAATGRFENLESTGMPLGMIDDFEYEQGPPVKIQQGDILVLATDGIVEAMNEKEEQFGQDRFVNIIRAGANKSANQIIKDCHDEVTKFCGQAKQRDDLTMVVLKFIRRGN